MFTHFIEKCSECDKVISQCRCPSKDKEVRYSICKECKSKLPPEDKDLIQYNNGVG